MYVEMYGELIGYYFSRQRSELTGRSHMFLRGLADDAEKIVIIDMLSGSNNSISYGFSLRRLLC